jgi:hypothetical protein
MASRRCCRSSTPNRCCARARPRALWSSLCARRHRAQLQPLFHRASVPCAAASLTWVTVANHRSPRRTAIRCGEIRTSDPEGPHRPGHIASGNVDCELGPMGPRADATSVEGFRAGEPNTIHAVSLSPPDRRAAHLAIRQPGRPAGLDRPTATPCVSVRMPTSTVVQLGQVQRGSRRNHASVGIRRDRVQPAQGSTAVTDPADSLLAIHTRAGRAYRCRKARTSRSRTS